MATASRNILVTKVNVFKSDFMLTENDKEIGTINFTKSFKSEAESHFGEQQWNLKITGFWKRELQYKGSHSPYQKGKLIPKWTGKISFDASNGKTYLLKRLTWYKSKWGWYDENDQPVMELRPDLSFSKKQAHIEVFQPSHPDLWLMLTIAWFNYILQKRQAAAAAT